MRCTVFGGSGYIGSALVSRLVTQGHEVTVLSRAAVDSRQSGLRYVKGSIADHAALMEALEATDLVYHLAWNGTPSPPTGMLDQTFDINVRQSLQLLETCVAQQVRRVIFCSSGGAVYGPTELPIIGEDHPLRPITPYGIAKVAVESFLEVIHRKSGLDYLIARPGNAYGGNQRTDGVQGILGRLIWCAERGHPVSVFGDGQMVRDFVHLDDIADALCLLGGYSGTERVFNIGTAKGTSVAELLNLLERYTQRSIARDFQPARWCDVTHNVLDHSRLTTAKGWRPQRCLEEEVAQLCKA